MKRREYISATAGVAGVAALSGVAFAESDLRIDGFRIESSIALVTSRKKTVTGQPALEDGDETVWATLVPDEAAARKRLVQPPLDERVKTQIVDSITSGHSAFWVAMVAVLPSQHTFQPGRPRFEGETLNYPDCRVIYDGSNGQGLSYHSLFHEYVRSLPIGTEPSFVEASWEFRDA